MNDDQISELYKGEIWSSALQERAQRRIHWMCSQVVGERVLDLGCSQGIASILLGREGFTVVGVDIQESRIEYARADLADESEGTRQNVSFELANGANLPFDDDSFDSVLLGEVVEHLTVPDKVLAEVRRVLVPGGRLILTTPFGLSPHHDHKRTFYPAGAVDVMSDLFTVTSLDVVDRYFRIVAMAAADGSGPGQLDFEDLLRHLEQAWESLDRDLSRSREALTAERKRSEAGLAKVKDQHRTELQQRTDKANALESALAQSDGKLGELGEEIERLKEELQAAVELRTAEEVRLSQAKQAASKQSDAMRRRSLAREQELLKRIDRLERDRWKLRNRLALANWRLQSTKQRKWWRLGAAIGAVRRNPLRVFVLPFDLVSIMFSRSNLPKRPDPIPEPGALRQVKKDPKSEPSAITSLIKAQDIGAIRPARQLVVATLVDQFTAQLLEHEVHTVPVTPKNWRDVLGRHPDLLFVESAWRGHGDTWLGKLPKEEGPREEFVEMAAEFRDAGVPVVFWNKEDPPSYDLFIGAARHADVVFTVAEELIPQYVSELGHDRVYLLPFSVQPRIHNPIWVGRRNRDLAFAGSYYAHKHAERMLQAEVVLDAARDFDFTIFSRLESSGDYRWPDRFEKHIAGTLTYDETLAAYKLFKVFLNINSVIDSDSMCSRRIFELAASGTPIVSGVSPAIDRYFGSTVLQAGEPREANQAMRALLRSEELRARLSALGIRTSHRHHTASMRMAEVLASVGIEDPAPPRLRPVSLVVPTNRTDLLENVLGNVGRQTYPEIQLVISAHGVDIDDQEFRARAADSGIEHVSIVRVESSAVLGTVLNRGFDAADGEVLSKMDDDDFYGAEYLWDLVQAFDYSDADIVGKWTNFAYLEGSNAMVLRYPGWEHRFSELVAGGTLTMKRPVHADVPFPDLATGEDSAFLRRAGDLGAKVYSTDRYNYVYMRTAQADRHTYAASDVYIAANGELVQFGLNLDHAAV